MRTNKTIAGGAAALMLTATLGACAQGGVAGTGLNKQTVGAGLGAAAGVGLGSAIGSGGGRTAAMIVGGLLGALVGSELGRAMDERDQLLAQQTTQDALESYPTGQAATWTNPDTGHSGEVRPRAAYRQGSQVCREFEQTIRIQGRAETATGVACRQNDGTWRVVNG